MPTSLTASLIAIFVSLALMSIVGAGFYIYRAGSQGQVAVQASAQVNQDKHVKALYDKNHSSVPHAGDKRSDIEWLSKRGDRQ